LNVTEHIWGLRSLPTWIRERLEEQIVDPLLGSIVYFSAGVVYRLLSEEPTA